MAYLNDRVLDLGLASLITEGTRFDLCSSQPASYAAIAGVTLGNGTPSFGAIAAGSPSGRQVSLSASGTNTATGSATCWAVSDPANSRLLESGPLATAKALVSGQGFSIPSFVVLVLPTASSGAAVPDAPSAPTVTALGPTSVDVAFSAPGSDGGSAITSYDLRWSTASDMTGATTVTGVTTGHDIASLTTSTRYYVQVRAVNAVGNGAWSTNGSAGTAVTWNPADKNASVVLSNGDLSCNQSTVGSFAVRATKFVSTGKYYFELYADDGPSTTWSASGYVGIADSGMTLTGTATVVAAAGEGFAFAPNGQMTVGGAVVFDVATWATPTVVVGVAVDMSIPAVYVAYNNTWQNSSNPAAGTGGQAFTAGSYAVIANPRTAAAGAGTGESFTLRSTTGAFTYTPPTGFTPLAEV